MMAHRLLWCLSDGQWRTLEELMKLASDCVRPERAARAGAYLHGHRSIEEAQERGKRIVLQDSLMPLIREGLIEVEKVWSNSRGKEAWSQLRIIPEAFRKYLKEINGRMLNELRDLLQAGRCHITVQVLPSNEGRNECEAEEAVQAAPSEPDQGE